MKIGVRERKWRKTRPKYQSRHETLSADRLGHSIKRAHVKIKPSAISRCVMFYFDFQWLVCDFEVKKRMSQIAYAPSFDRPIRSVANVDIPGK